MEIILLLFFHHVGDVWAQPSWLIENKKKHLFALYEHVFIYSGVVSFALILTGHFSLWKFFFIAVTHFITDWLFYQGLPKILNKEKQYNWVYYDQFMHYVQIIFAYFL